MPKRPANVSGSHDIAQVVNQNLRELNTQIDALQRQITALQQVQQPIITTITINFGTIAANGQTNKTIPVPAATTKMAAFASPNGALAGGAGDIFIWDCYVIANGQVGVSLNNIGANPSTPPIIPWTIVVI